jgi:hypothetical protein
MQEPSSSTVIIKTLEAHPQPKKTILLKNEQTNETPAGFKKSSSSSKPIQIKESKNRDFSTKNHTYTNTTLWSSSNTPCIKTKTSSSYISSEHYPSFPSS